MKSELQDDVFMLDKDIVRLKEQIRNQEAALNSKDISKLPLDSLHMIIGSINLELEISELTFNKMNNLGLTSLSDNDGLNSSILESYNSDVTSFKSANRYVLGELVKRTSYFLYDQDKVDLSLIYESNLRRFPSLYKQTEEDYINSQRLNVLEFIYSTKGRQQILWDFDGKEYSLGHFERIQSKTMSPLDTIYAELKNHDPKIAHLPILPSSAIDSIE